MGQGRSRSRAARNETPAGFSKLKENRSVGVGKNGEIASPCSSTSGEEKAWSISTPRLFDLLAPADHVLIAGCGGGYDILSGLPLYFSLRAQGKRVTLANLSFTNLSSTGAKEFCRGCYAVTSSLKPKNAQDSYFPELYLARWLKEKEGGEKVIYAFARDIGVRPLSNAYRKLVSHHRIQAVLLVDGGTDSIMFGSEEKMGTPGEDHCSMAAVNAVPVPIKVLTCLGFGVDFFHGVSHGLFLENVAALEKAGGYLGCFSVPQSSREGQFYMAGYQAVSQHMQPSIVCSSIIDAMQGRFGDHHSTSRTGGSKLFINPLMAIYWTFDLPKVMDQIEYAGELEATETRGDVLNVIYKYNSDLAKQGKIRAALPLPM